MQNDPYAFYCMTTLGGFALLMFVMGIRGDDDSAYPDENPEDDDTISAEQDGIKEDVQ